MKCCEIHAGMLRHKIRLQREKLTPDGGGGWQKEWEEYASVFAYIKPVSGSEALYGMQLQDTITHDIYIRYRTVVAKDVVVYNTRRFNIVSVINVDEKNVWLRLRCEEGVAT